MSEIPKLRAKANFKIRVKLENNEVRLLNFVVTQSGENCKWPGVPYDWCEAFLHVRKLENKCKNKHKVQKQQSKVQTRTTQTTDLASYSLTQ